MKFATALKHPSKTKGCQSDALAAGPVTGLSSTDKTSVRHSDCRFGCQPWSQTWSHTAMDPQDSGLPIETAQHDDTGLADNDVQADEEQHHHICDCVGKCCGARLSALACWTCILCLSVCATLQDCAMIHLDAPVTPVQASLRIFCPQHILWRSWTSWIPLEA